MAYSGLAGRPAVLTQASANSAGDTARVVLSGFSFHQIRDDRTRPPLLMDRVHHLADILAWLRGTAPVPTGIGGTPGLRNTLAQNYPNPFNPTTVISYGIKERAHVSLRIYNVAGQLVRTLVDDVQSPRASGFSVRWDGRNNSSGAVSSGVYFYRLVTKNFTRTKKMVMLK